MINRIHLPILFVHESSSDECGMFVVGTKRSYGYVAEQNGQNAPSELLAVGRVL